MDDSEINGAEVRPGIRPVASKPVADVFLVSRGGLR